MSFNMKRNITTGQVASYLLMPQVVPRIRQFYQEGFSNLAYIVALVYRAVNIIPENHRILQRANRSSLGLREVMAAAGAEIKFTKEHIDQVIVYYAIMAGMVLLAAQFFMTLAFIMVNPAFAQTMPTNYGDFFSTPNQKEDIAYRLLWSVFGVPELFNSGGVRTSFHIALHSMFQLYSVGLLVIAVIIVCYFIFAIVIETAQTGVPFGKRYNHVWTPIRLVFALGLLVPVGYGLNSAQWITLYAAKFGSDFATKGWVLFNDKMSSETLTDSGKLIGTPQAPDLMDLATNMMLVNACVKAYSMIYHGANAKVLNMYFVKMTTEDEAPKTREDYRGGYNEFTEAHKDFGYGDILIRFGEYNKEKHKNEIGKVKPYCGEIAILSSDTTEPGAKYIQEQYWYIVGNMYEGLGGGEQPYPKDLKEYAENMVQKYWEGEAEKRKADAKMPPANFKEDVAAQIAKQLKREIDAAVKEQEKSPTLKSDKEELQKYGWGGAGIWYNKIAQVNGSLVTAVNNVPVMRKMPEVMEYIKIKKLQENTNQADFFSSLMLSDSPIEFDSKDDETIAKTLSAVSNYWTKDVLQQSGSGSQTRSTGNIFVDVVNLVFGTRGLFNMCANADVHPLAQLSALGKGLIEATIRNLAGAMLLSLGSVMGSAVGSAMGAASSILLSVGTITLTMGFMLFYVLPFMPFLYFFFAVGGWIKGLFEAMVGVPLWALAHLRIDGEGLPGDAASNGIYLIFEIFLRPILIVFGLLASVVIFASMVKVLNEIFSLVVSNLSGHDNSFTTLCGKAAGTTGGGSPATVSGASGSAVQYFRGPIDELFFTVIYAVIVYMIGMSCFKLIDLIPNNILRYMGANVPTFGDKQADAAEGLMTTLSVATGSVSGKLFGGNNSIVGGATGALTNSLKGISDLASPPPPPKSGE